MVEKPLGALTPWAGAGCKRLRVETCVTSREGSITIRVCVQKKIKEAVCYRLLEILLVV